MKNLELNCVGKIVELNKFELAVDIEEINNDFWICNKTLMTNHALDFLSEVESVIKLDMNKNYIENGNILSISKIVNMRILTKKYIRLLNEDYNDFESCNIIFKIQLSDESANKVNNLKNIIKTTEELFS